MEVIEQSFQMCNVGVLVRSLITIILKRILRTFLGVGYLFGGKTIRILSHIWFKQLEWAALTSALFLLGMRTEKYGVSGLFYFFGVLSLILIIISTSHSFNKITDGLSLDLEGFNKKHERLSLGKYSYGTHFGLVAVIIIFLLSIGNIFIIFFAMSAFL